MNHRANHHDYLEFAKMRGRSRSMIAVTTKLLLLPYYPGVHEAGVVMPGQIQVLLSHAWDFGAYRYFVFVFGYIDRRHSGRKCLWEGRKSVGKLVLKK